VGGLDKRGGRPTLVGSGLVPDQGGDKPRHYLMEEDIPQLFLSLDARV